MKYRVLIGLLVLVLCGSSLVLAKDKKESESVAPLQASAQAEMAKRQKEILIADINNMRNQELRVAILQQLINEEIAKLRNVQAVFCDQYKLDIDKFRKGLYQYDDKQGKFIEDTKTK